MTITLICVILTVELLAAQTASPSMAEMSKDSLGEKVELRKVARPNRSVNQFYLVGGSILLLVLIMGWIYTYRQMAKKNEDLKIKNEEQEKIQVLT